MEKEKIKIEDRVAEFEKHQTVKTWRGHKINLFTGPTPDQIDILDIAHQLAMQCRFTGAIDHFYSIAEHSIYVAMLAPPIIRPYCLFHDSPEYVLHDWNKPLKNLVESKTNIYEEITEKFERVIMEKFGLSYQKFKDLYLEIKELDLQVYDYERRFINQIGNTLPEGHPLHGMPFGMTWEQAESEFLNMFEQCYLEPKQ